MLLSEGQEQEKEQEREQKQEQEQGKEQELEQEQELCLPGPLLGYRLPYMSTRAPSPLDT